MIVEITFIRGNYVREFICVQELQPITLRILQMEKGAGLMEMLCPVGENVTWWKEKQRIILLVIPFCFRRALAQFRSQESQKLKRRYLCLCLVHIKIKI